VLLNSSAGLHTLSTTVARRGCQRTAGSRRASCEIVGALLHWRLPGYARFVARTLTAGQASDDVASATTDHEHSSERRKKCDLPPCAAVGGNGARKAQI
jgi:hypothetical protein